MKAPRGLVISPSRQRGEYGTYRVDVRLRRRSLYAFRLLFRSARSAGVTTTTAFRFALMFCLSGDR